MNPLRSYPKVYNLGHPSIRELFDGPVVVQEKVDGSQFSFGVVDGELKCRSRGAELPVPCTDKLFKGAVETAERLFQERRLIEGWVYRGEALFRPKHNTLEYQRVPEGNVILFDIDQGYEDRLFPSDLEDHASAMGLEVVPTFFTTKVSGPEDLEGMLEAESVLGGAVEGVVIKNYNRFNEKNGKMLMGKYVSPAFKEKHTKDWKARHPGRGDVIDKIVESLATEARYQKAVQHLREAGNLEGAPQDIGPLMAECQKDLESEEAEWIKEQLYDHFRKKILRGVSAGIPRWYKEQLVELQFSEGEIG